MLNKQVFLIATPSERTSALAALLRMEGYRVVPCGAVEDFLERVDRGRHLPACLVAQLEITGLEVFERLREASVSIPTILLSLEANVPMAVQAMKAGAFHFYAQPIDVSRVLGSVREALERDAIACDERQNQSDVWRRVATLTPREQQVMELLVTGQATKQIAARLGINCKTVFVHRARVMQKMGVDSLVELSLLVTQARAHAVKDESQSPRPELTIYNQRV